MRLWISIILLLMTITGCGTDEQGRIRIRIRNDSDQDITNFWLGAGGPSNASYGSIPVGSTTSYQSFEPVLARYRKCNFVTADGTRHLDTIYPEEHLGAPELGPGSYTFAYTIANGEAQLTLTQDE